jgi:hypothetical protein
MSDGRSALLYTFPNILITFLSVGEQKTDKITYNLPFYKLEVSEYEEVIDLSINNYIKNK